MAIEFWCCKGELASQGGDEKSNVNVSSIVENRILCLL